MKTNNNNNNKYKIAIVGATGLVGKEFISILEERKFPISELIPFASISSKGLRVRYLENDLPVKALEEYDGDKFDIALFSIGVELSLKWSPKFATNGAIVIDNSNAFRMDPKIPLIVPEVNSLDIKFARNKNIIANPNCSTIEMVVTLKPLDDYAKIKRIVVSTYQSTSGAGKEAVEELSKQVIDILNFREVKKKVFPHQIAFNSIPHIDVFDEDGYTKEELKMERETSKIMGRDIPLTATCVRVPTFSCHAEAINVEFEKEITPLKATELLSKAKGIKVIDDIKKNLYPMQIEASGKDETFVGRIRKDRSLKNALNLWVVSDNLRKGAALNAVQIAEELLEKKII